MKFHRTDHSKMFKEGIFHISSPMAYFGGCHGYNRTSSDYFTPPIPSTRSVHDHTNNTHQYVRHATFV